MKRLRGSSLAVKSEGLGVKKETVKSEKVDGEGPVQQPPAVKAEAKGAPLFKRRKRE